MEGYTIGISSGDVNEPELLKLGLSEYHITDTTRIIARALLATGANLIYGGIRDFVEPKENRQNLLTDLFEMIRIYNRTGKYDFRPLTNYSPWPFWLNVNNNWCAKYISVLKFNRHPVPDEASDFVGKSTNEILESADGRMLVGISLSNMRKKITEESKARIVVGGLSSGFKGFYPGIIEEAVYAIRQNQPTYILGGFGGASNDVVNALMGESPNSFDINWQIKNTKNFKDLIDTLNSYPNVPNIDYKKMLKELNDKGVEAISENNGLCNQENQRLWETNILDEAIQLIMKGLQATFEKLD